jgi:hypothetical protein
LHVFTLNIIIDLTESGLLPQSAGAKYVPNTIILKQIDGALSKNVLECHVNEVQVNMHMMFTACLSLALPKPERSNISSGLMRNSHLLNKQMIIVKTD